MIDLLDDEADQRQQTDFPAMWMKVRTMLYRYFLVLKRRWWIAVLTTLAGVGVAIWCAQNLPPSYMSVARMMVSGRINLAEGVTYTEEAGNYFGTQAELMESGEVQAPALARVQSLRPDLSPVKVEFSAAQQPKTSIFVLQAIASDPVYAREYLNAAMDEYIASKRSMRSEKSDAASTALDEDIDKVELELVNAEKAMLAFQQANNLGYLKEEGNSAALYLANLNRQYAELSYEHELLEKLTVDQSLDREPDRFSQRDTAIRDRALSSFGPMSDYLKARQQLQLLVAERDQLAEYMKPKHPDIIRLNEEISRVERLIETYRAQSSDQLQNRRDTIALQMKTMNEMIGRYEVKAVDLSAKLAEHEKLRANVERFRGLYDRLQNNLRNVDMTKSLDQDMISILERASESLSVRAGLVKMLLIGFGAGLIAGLGILLLIERLDDRLASIMDVQNHFEERVLGQIVHEDQVAGRLELLHADDQRHSFVEAFRSLRSSFLYPPDGKPAPRTILITSAIPGEGKSTTSSNLAVAFALSGARTLLVDLDLRRGTVHTGFRLNNDAGMAEVLKKAISWKEATNTTDWENLSVITRGGLLNGPGEHLMGSGLDQFLKEASQEYDYVIIDSAPVMVAEDTPTLARKVDAAALVVRFNLSSARLSRRSLERLADRRVNVMGIVLNEITASMPEYGYHHYGSYYADPVEAK
ncbi:MAG: GumC family protein [Chthoniobacteraceae bacterium]